MQTARQLAQLVERERQLLTGVFEQRASGRGVLVQLVQRDAEAERQRDDPLLCAVVQVALEPAPLDVAGGDDARPRRGELLEPGMQLDVEPMHLGLLRLALADVRVGDEVADVATRRVPDGRGRDRDGHQPPILALADGLVVVDRLARQHAREQVLALVALGGLRHREAGAAQDLLVGPAEDALGRRVPETDPRVLVELHERDRRGVDQRLQPLLLLLAPGDVGVGDEVADDAARPRPARARRRSRRGRAGRPCAAGRSRSR